MAGITSKHGELLSAQATEKTEHVLIKAQSIPGRIRRKRFLEKQARFLEVLKVDGQLRIYFI